MIEGITERYLAVGTFHYQVRFFGERTSLMVDSVASRIRDLPGVDDAFIVYEGIGLLYSEDRRSGVVIRAFEDGFIERDRGFLSYMTFSGNVPTGDRVAVSAEAAAELGIAPGDDVGIVVARTLSNGRFILKQHAGAVSGTFSAGYTDLDANIVLVSAASATELFPDAGNAFIGIKVDDPFGDQGDLPDRIRSELPSGAYLYGWRELERGMYATFETTKSLLIIVMAVIAGVATITISTSLLLLVFERETELALLRGTGAHSRDLRDAFVALGFAVGSIGSLLGVGVGLCVALGINELFAAVEYILSHIAGITSVLTGRSGNGGSRILDPTFYLSHIPVRISLFRVLAVTSLSIALSTVSAWIPARRAGLIIPAETLARH
jgi:lipoprotein-releasing system permease protein